MAIAGRAVGRSLHSKQAVTTTLFVSASIALCPALVHGQNTALNVRTSQHTGLARFVTAADGGEISVPLPAGKARPQPDDFFKAYGHLFGITDASTQLVLEKSQGDAIGQTHTTYRQVHGGVPVFGGVVKLHQDASGRFTAANGAFFPIPDKLDTKPAIDRRSAEQIARRSFTGDDATIERQELVIVDPGWYGDPQQGARLAYYFHLVDWNADFAEGFFIDAQTGRVLDHWNLAQTSKSRIVFDGGEATDLPGALVRVEGGPATLDPDADAAYDYGGDAYDYYQRAFGRDSVDGLGLPLAMTVHTQAISCPNAQWRGDLAVFCSGTASDDVVAHELTHGLTENTAQLIYQNQPGQLNESISDIFGELVDLFNGDAAFPGPPGGAPWPSHDTGPGTDTPNDLRPDGCVTGVKVEVNAPAELAGDYVAARALFGPQLDETGLTANVVVADPVLACEALTNPGQINGKIALIDRGSCNFTDKVKNAQNAGAIAVIIADSNPIGPPPVLGGTDPTVTIPSVSITYADGALIRSSLLSGDVNVTVAANDASAGVRWLMGEDAWGFGGAIRDMWNPPCEGDPDRANSPFQVCDPLDNGGVHSGSGVPNHAFAIMTDGQDFNGYSVSGIGPIKAAAVWYRALTVYFTVTTDFADAYDAVNQAAVDLIGTTPLDPRTGLSSGNTFTADDADQVDKALLAVEMNTPGLCGAWIPVLDDTPPKLCDGRQDIYYEDDFENGINGWTVFNTEPPTPYDWLQRGSLPAGRSGTAWFVADPSIGDCFYVDESAVHYLTSPVIDIPADPPALTMAFTHRVFTEPGWDGGNVEISVSGGPFEVIPGTHFIYNAYNMTLQPAPDNTNPLAGEEGFSGLGGEWGTSLVDVSAYVSGGETVQFRFAFGKDGCGGYDGWYVDDFVLYGCIPYGDGDFDVNQRVDLRDHQIFQQCMDQPAIGICAPGDMNADRTVNVDDLPPWEQALDGPQ